MYRIRFNLAAGPTFMQWQVKDLATGEVTHYDPSTTQLALHGARLRNRPATARKIHSGANKSVCAWIDADLVVVHPTDPIPLPPDDTPRVAYNPRVAPYWRDRDGSNIDGTRFPVLLTWRRMLY